MIRHVPGRPAVLRGHELTSLDERLGLLLLVRMAMVAVVVLGALVAQDQLGIALAQIGPLSAGYLVVAGGAEWYRRSSRRGRMALHRAMLPADAIYLVLVTTPAGGPRSQLVFLFSVHLIAVTLLASQRTGIRIALWDSFLFIVIPTLSLSGRIGTLLGVQVVAAPPAAETALAIMGFWAVALCTAFFSSVSERELRRSKAELAALAQMASDLEGEQGEEEILTILLRTVVEAFHFRRGGLWWNEGGRARGITLAGRDPGYRVVQVLAEGEPGSDQVAAEAAATRRAVLVRHLEAPRDPVAARLLPGALNVVVLSVPRGTAGVATLLLEHGGHPLEARLPRQRLDMLAQFTSHTSLALKSAQLLSERERLATMDGLTGLANRREFDQALSREVSRSERTGEPLSLVVLDVDHFKDINDTRGHLGGDEVLRQLSGVLAASVREMDLVARYGGEEFALVLPRCTQPDALRVVERFTVASREDPALAGVTLSSGVATLPDNARDGLALVEAADEALYRSKRAGRDRVTVSDRRHGPGGVPGWITSTGTSG